MGRSSHPLIILGGGYTGKVIYHQALKLQRPIFISSRKPESHLQSFPKKEQIGFNLENAESWRSLPENGDLIWTFPAVPIEKVHSFIREKGRIFRRILVIGSTSAYQVDSRKGPVVVDESFPVDLTDPRVAGEEALRKTLGAIILRSAGIYGSGRNPLDWIREGRFKNSQKYLNLIHVQDLAQVALLALEKGLNGEVFNVSDGIPRRFSEIVEEATNRWNIAPPPLSSNKNPGKQISNHKMLVHFNYSFKFPDLFTALDEIEKNKNLSS